MSAEECREIKVELRELRQRVERMTLIVVSLALLTGGDLASRLMSAIAGM